MAGGVHRRRATGLSFYVVDDADQNGDGVENECLEDNKGAGVDDVTCPDLN